MKRSICTILITSLIFIASAQQGEPTVAAPCDGGLKVDLDQAGQKYFRLITWHQFWAATPNGLEANGFSPELSLRRSRVLLYAQLSDRFLILTHFGLNNLNYEGLHPTGQSSQAQLFLHDAWVEYRIAPELFVGGGLHYWNGISRLNNQGTLNIMPLDNPRFAWATIGTSDQFGRHMGVYAKGSIHQRLQYRFSWNQPIANSFDHINELEPDADRAVYRGTAMNAPQRPDNAFSGYVNYQFIDIESNKLPYMVGSYLGTKRVFTVGGGFFYHPEGSITRQAENGTPYESHDVLLWAVDAYLDMPVGEHKEAISLYAGYFNYDFGPNYQLSGTSTDIASSTTYYAQAGYLLRPFSEKFRLQPYLTGALRRLDAFDNALKTEVQAGINFFITDHNAKVSLQYGQRALNGAITDQIILQAHIFL